MEIHDELSEFLDNKRTFLDDADPSVVNIPDEERKANVAETHDSFHTLQRYPTIMGGYSAAQ